MTPIIVYAFFLCASFPFGVHSLSSTVPVKRARPIKKIAVIGSGISGLGVAHALDSLSDEQDDLEISLFDARSSLNIQDGSGVQINGGLAAIGKFNKNLQKAIMEAGLPQKKIESRAKAWKDPSSSTYSTLLELDLDNLVRNAGGDVTAGLVQDDGVLWYAIMRGALQKVLLDHLPAHVAEKIQVGKRLSGIATSESDDEPGVFCEFSDDSIYGPFDMVLGCDGVRSAVRDYIEKGKVGSGETGIYSGISITYAVEDGDPVAKTQPTSTGLTQYFGDGAYALSGVYGNGKDKPPSKCSFLVELDQGYFGPFKRKTKEGENAVDENVDWIPDDSERLEEERQDMMKGIKAANIPDFDMAPSVSTADRFFEIGVYFHSPFSFKGWSKEVSEGSWAVLVGDAAHAMPPFLGQGANQALQDAYTLATKICKYNTLVRGRAVQDDGEDEEDISLGRLLKEYERKRWFPTTSISVKSAFLGYLECGGFDGAYSKFRDVFFRGMGIIGVAKSVLLDAATPKL